MNEVKYPALRSELVQHLEALSNPEYQQDVWVKGNSRGKIEHDEFDYVVHFLFDDTPLAEEPQSTIGWILRDQTEAERIARLTAALDEIFIKYGTALTDEQYIALREWPTVVSRANDCLALLRD